MVHKAWYCDNSKSVFLLLRCHIFYQQNCQDDSSFASFCLLLSQEKTMESLGSLTGKENNSSTKKCLNVGKNREGYGLKTLGPVLSFQTAEKPCKTSRMHRNPSFLFTFYSLSKLQNNLTSLLNISIHRHHHLTISLSGYRARNNYNHCNYKKAFLKPYNLHNPKKLATVSI